MYWSWNNHSVTFNFERLPLPCGNWIRRLCSLHASREWSLSHTLFERSHLQIFQCRKVIKQRKELVIFLVWFPKKMERKQMFYNSLPFFMFREIKYYSRLYFLINLERREFLLKQNNGEFKAITLYYKKLSNYFNIFYD